VFLANRKQSKGVSKAKADVNFLKNFQANDGGVQEQSSLNLIKKHAGTSHGI